MATTFEPGFSESPADRDLARGEPDDDRSIGEALRITLLFVTVVILLLWAGVADAACAPSPESPAASSRP